MKEEVFINEMTRWHRLTLVKRGLAFKINEDFTYTKPKGFDEKPLISFELNPRHRDLFKKDNPPKMSFAITDALQVIAWEPSTQTIIKELCQEATTLPLGVMQCLKGVHRCNLQYAAWATHKSLTEILLNRDPSQRLALCGKRPNSFKLEKWDDPPPRSSWLASAEALANFTIHGFLSMTDDYPVTVLTPDDGEDFYRVQMDSTVQKVFQLWDTFVQVPEPNAPLHIGRFRIERSLNPRLATRKDLEWSPILTTDENVLTAEILPMLVTLGVSTQLSKVLAFVEDEATDFFTLPVKELKENHEDIDYFRARWKV